MGIDWFTFFAQIFNFLILVLLLKRFLYRPVLNAMTRRQERIAKHLTEAEAKAAESDAEKQRYIALQEEARTQIAQEMRKARAEAETLRDALMTTAKKEVETQRKEWIASLEKEEEAFLAETSNTIVEYFQQLNRSALRELAGKELEEHVVSVFLHKLETVDQITREELAKHVTADGEPVLINTAFQLSALQEESIQQKLNAIVGAKANYRFSINKELLIGIALEVGGKKIHWDMHAYLKRFENKLTLYLKDHPTVK